jgi:hypothetical protein
LIEVNISNLP